MRVCVCWGGGGIRVSVQMLNEKVRDKKETLIDYLIGFFILGKT
jgi:hypothetical protein